MSREKSGKSNGDDMFGPEPWTLWYKRHTKAIVICLCVVAVGVLAWYFWPHGHGDSSTNKVAQQTLETSLSAALNSSNDQEIINISGQLISGVNSGVYHSDNETLAHYHLDRAASYINIQQYAKVTPDSEAAAKLSTVTKKAALEFEFEARYKLGERQPLIPLLNQLIQFEQSGMNPMKSSAIAQYQLDISYIQHNKEITF